MANNNALYNAVIAGVSGGSNNRWIAGTPPAVLADFANNVAAIAVAVDAAIAPIVGGPTQSQIDLLTSISQGVYEGRYALAGVNHASIATSIANVFVELSTELLPVTAVHPNETTVLTKYPTGFENRTDSAIGFDDLTRTFTITGNYAIWYHGTKITKAGVSSIVWDDVEGIQVIYFDSTGTIRKTADTNVIRSIVGGDGVIIAALYWDAVNNVSIRRMEERHDVSLPPATHLYLHEFIGTVIQQGGAQLSNFSITGGGGNAAANAQFSISDYSISDEDIRIGITNNAPQALSPIATIPIYYLSGAGVWREKPADVYPVIYSGTAGYVGANGRLPWNELNGGNWLLTQVTEGNYVLCHYFATTDITKPTIGVIGQAVYTTSALARVGANYEINRLRNLLNLFSTEKRAIGSVIFQTGQGYTNVPKAKVVVTDLLDNYVDWLATPVFTGVVKDA